MAIRHDGRSATTFGAAQLALPRGRADFALMALLTVSSVAVRPGHALLGRAGCVTAGRNHTMYVLMSAVHSAPWLKLISSRTSGAR